MSVLLKQLTFCSFAINTRDTTRSPPLKTPTYATDTKNPPWIPWNRRQGCWKTIGIWRNYVLKCLPQFVLLYNELFCMQGQTCPRCPQSGWMGGWMGGASREPAVRGWGRGPGVAAKRPFKVSRPAMPALEFTFRPNNAAECRLEMLIVCN